MRASGRFTGLQRFFAGLTEHTFHSRLGVVDPDLVSYLSDLLARFVRTDAVYRIRSLAGRPLHEVADMLMEAEERIGDARREAHRHIGDFTLFWVGIYPEALKKMRGPLTKDQLLDYREQGKRSYFIASRIAADEQLEAPAEVLGRLSDQYDLCAFGLGEVRREWQRREELDDPPGPLLIN